MNFGKVLGVVVSTQKDHSLNGVKLYVLEPQDEKRKKIGEPIIAVDTIGSGEGDQVIWVSSREASLALDEPFAPVDAAIVGIVDSFYIEAEK